jgi:hypothetical protein
MTLSLLNACRYKDKELANEILKSKDCNVSNFGNVGKNGNTALIWACKNNLDKVSLKILKKKQ